MKTIVYYRLCCAVNNIIELLILLEFDKKNKYLNDTSPTEILDIFESVTLEKLHKSFSYIIIK